MNLALVFVMHEGTAALAPLSSPLHLPSAHTCRHRRPTAEEIWQDLFLVLFLNKWKTCNFPPLHSLVFLGFLIYSNIIQSFSGVCVCSTLWMDELMPLVRNLL